MKHSAAEQDNENSLYAGTNRKPSDGLELSTPSLPARVSAVVFVASCVVVRPGAASVAPLKRLLRVRSRDAVFVGVADGLGAVSGTGLLEDVVDVSLDGGGADNERSCDLCVGEAGCDQLEDFDFTRGEFVG